MPALPPSISAARTTPLRPVSLPSARIQRRVVGQRHDAHFTELGQALARDPPLDLQGRHRALAIKPVETGLGAETAVACVPSHGAKTSWGTWATPARFGRWSVRVRRWPAASGIRSQCPIGPRTHAGGTARLQ
ncbi:hypothetical protein G6F59_016770 [Rhizopus arrhizus]|nr:hypothetical protein G6F59_016770 [Rhizopus arrhizus]